MKKIDLIIIGAGIMGLTTAYYASLLGKSVVILEKRTVGNKEAGSFSLTRSIRNDYLDPLYAGLAAEARVLWEEIQKESEEEFLVNSGCLNIANKKITPVLNKTYAIKSFNNISQLGFDSSLFTKKELQKKYQQFNADIATLDKKAGILYVPPITKTLLKLLKKNSVVIKENINITKIEETSLGVTIKTNKTVLKAKKIVITAGIWTNDVLKIVKNNQLYFPITPDRPNQCKYFFIPKKMEKFFTPDTFPVFAYLDIGIYGHPLLPGKTKGIKIGYYNPTDFKQSNNKIKSIEDFITYCMPILNGLKSENVTDADQCYYELVSDDDFIIGSLPRFKNIFVGCGWRGTGYKFAPLIGKILAQLSMQTRTVYDIDRFDPSRFTKDTKIDKMR